MIGKAISHYPALRASNVSKWGCGNNRSVCFLKFALRSFKFLEETIRLSSFSEI
jgi:hypothetical protein